MNLFTVEEACSCQKRDDRGDGDDSFDRLYVNVCYQSQHPLHTQNKCDNNIVDHDISIRKSANTFSTDGLIIG